MGALFIHEREVSEDRGRAHLYERNQQRDRKREPNSPREQVVQLLYRHDHRIYVDPARV